MLQALTRWGGALLELAHFKQGGEASEMINEVGTRYGWRGGGSRQAHFASCSCTAECSMPRLQVHTAALCMLSLLCPLQLESCVVCRPSAGWSAPLTLTAPVQMPCGASAMPTPPR